jgi:hypothetical protein
MKKITAVLRSLVLVTLVVLILWNTPGDVFGSPDSMVQVRRIQSLFKAAWVAVGWIAIETAVAWFVALRRSKPATAPKGGKEAPPAAPGAGPAAGRAPSEPTGK